MTGAAGEDGLTAVLTALRVVQDQLEELGERGRRIEANQVGILARLDGIDAAQAGLADLEAVLQFLLRVVAEGRSATTDDLKVIAEMAGRAHAAAIGNRRPLPADILDNPLLERYVLSQPSDQVSVRRALVDWRRLVQSLEVADLTMILQRQYRPSPTDGADDRTLRYQLAAITREELEDRGAPVPPPPLSTVAGDRSDAARQARSTELARLWQIGDNITIHAEPELAGALDIFAAAKREGANMDEAELAAGLADLRRTVADRLAAGDRPVLANNRQQAAPVPEFDQGR